MGLRVLFTPRVISECPLLWKLPVLEIQNLRRPCLRRKDCGDPRCWVPLGLVRHSGSPAPKETQLLQLPSKCDTFFKENAGGKLVILLPH